MWDSTQHSNLEANLWDAADELRANSELADFDREASKLSAAIADFARELLG